MRRKFAAGLFAVLMALASLMVIPGQQPAQAAVDYGNIRVLISNGTPKNLFITLTGSFTVVQTGAAAPTGSVTITNNGGTLSMTGGGKTTAIGPTITFKNANYDGTGNKVSMTGFGSKKRDYLGDMQFTANSGSVRAINTIGLEQYLIGVLNCEMSSSWPLEALKAQAVAARTYAARLIDKNGSAYDILDNTTHQAYGGYFSAAQPIQAINETKGQVLRYGGKFVETYYTASNGGQTEVPGNAWPGSNDAASNAKDASYPYLKMKVDDYDRKNSRTVFERVYIPKALSANWSGVNSAMKTLILNKLGVTSLDGSLTVTSIKIGSYKYPRTPASWSYESIILVVNYKGATKNLTFTHNEMRNSGAFKQSSTYAKMFSWETVGSSGWNLTNSRFGHGVGMSQHGAQQRAEEGQGYRDILAFYYDGTTIEIIGTNSWQQDTPTDGQTGWQQQADGQWMYLVSGVPAKGWKKVGSKWYYLDPTTGLMWTGLHEIDGKLYFLTGSGSMAAGKWQKIDNKWYYFNQSGAAVKGWIKLSGKWYYLNPDNAVMMTGLIHDGKYRYILNSSGDMLYGTSKNPWKKLGGQWYYLNTSGAVQTGWRKTGGKWYYMNPDNGQMMTGVIKDNTGMVYVLKNGGAMVIGTAKKPWVRSEGNWYFIDSSSGAARTGWRKDGRNWYYMDLESAIMRTGWLDVDGKRYYLEANGAMATGIKEIDGQTYTFNRSGELEQQQ